MKLLAPNFTLAEMTRSAKASVLGIPNQPNDAQLENLMRTAAMLQPVRDLHFALLGAGIHLNSGFRSPELNEAVGGSQDPLSAHTDGRAADVESYRCGNAELTWLFVLQGNYDKLILEYHRADQPNSGWVHVQVRKQGGQNRQLIYIKDWTRNYAPVSPDDLLAEYGLDDWKKRLQRFCSDHPSFTHLKKRKGA